jgi:hypothetical protein
MIAINVNDLLDRSWEDMDCLAIVKEGLRRQGQIEAAASLPCDPESASKLVTEKHAQWRLVGDSAHQAAVGDVLVADSADGLHVSLCVDSQYAITSSERHGAHRMRTARLMGISGVYRWGEHK